MRKLFYTNLLENIMSTLIFFIFITLYYRLNNSQISNIFLFHIIKNFINLIHNFFFYNPKINKKKEKRKKYGIFLIKKMKLCNG